MAEVSTEQKIYHGKVENQLDPNAKRVNPRQIYIIRSKYKIQNSNKYN